MDWDVGFLILNGAYLVYLASAVFKEILWLRMALLLATLMYIAYGFIEPLWPLVYWNIAFGSMQIYQIWKLIKQRLGVKLDEEAEAIRVLMFSGLDRPMFNLLWQSGRQAVYRDGETLIEYDTQGEDLMLILEGEVDVRPPDRDPADPIRLGRLRLLGEMSAVSGQRTRATVTAKGLVRTRNWRQSDLEELGEENPAIEKHALLLIGTELARKVL